MLSIGMIIMVNKDLEKWFENYPYLVPCIFCIYYRSIGRGTPASPASVKQIYGTIYSAPCCWYGFIFDEPRGDLPLDGKCAKFKARYHYKYFQEDFQK